MKLPIVRPYFPDLNERVTEWFSECLELGQVTNGTWVNEFERQLARYCGGGDVGAVAFCNGQTALLAMLMAAGVWSDDEVVLPSFTFCGTPAAVSMLGAVPRFADIDPVTLTLDPLSAASQITDRTNAVLGVDVYGLCCDYSGMSRMPPHIPVLYDSAPAFGSMPQQPTATRIFSFHATKPFSTMEGGALVSSDAAILEYARRIREFGQDRHRNCVDIGLNGKMAEICAIIGLENLRTFDERRRQRIASAAGARRWLSRVHGVKVIDNPPEQEPIWTYMPILAESNEKRDRMLARLKSRDIDARVYYTACHKLPPYDSELTLPVTEDIAARVIALPLYDEMTADELDYICEALS